MQPYSMDLRERVLSDCDAGLPTKKVAKKFSVSPAWVRRLKQRRRESGEIAPRHGKTGPKPKLGEHLQRLEELVQEFPDATLEELQQKLKVLVGVTTIWRALKSLGITLKKSDPRG